MYTITALGQQEIKGTHQHHMEATQMTPTLIHVDTGPVSGCITFDTSCRHRRCRRKNYILHTLKRRLKSPMCLRRACVVFACVSLGMCHSRCITKALRTPPLPKHLHTFSYCIHTQHHLHTHGQSRSVWIQTAVLYPLS